MPGLPAEAAVCIVSDHPEELQSSGMFHRVCQFRTGHSNGFNAFVFEKKCVPSNSAAQLVWPPTP